jgi:hypothetical protein
MSRIKLLWLLPLAVVLPVQVLFGSAGTITYAVGTCKPGLPSYSSISAAVAATPPPNVVLVCPGPYQEQVVITQPLTLQGVSTGDSAQAIIEPPGGGLPVNALNDFGFEFAPQIWVDNVTGPVNISNITVDGTNNMITSCQAQIVGIFYQNSSGTVNRVTTRNQKGNGCGVGIWLEGGTSSPSVIVENSDMHDFDDTGIDAESNSEPAGLTATIKGNYVNGPSASCSYCFGIVVFDGVAAAVTGNIVANTRLGIQAFNEAYEATGSISGNTVTTSSYGIGAFTDGVSVTSNKIFNIIVEGIDMSTSVAEIQDNNIINSSIGIEFNCNANGNVSSNTILDAVTGLDQVPDSVAPKDSYFSVGTIRNGC